MEEHDTARHVIVSMRALRLAFNLAKAQFRLRIAGKYLGIFWYLLEPLAFFLIFILLRSSLNVGSIPEYPLYLLLGLIMINFFTAVTGGAIRSLRENRNLIKSVTIDVEALPLATVIQFCLSHAFEAILFIVFAFYYHDMLWTIVLYPAIFAVYAVFVLGVSLAVSAAGVFIEDLDNIWAVFSRLLWLATPIFYALSSGTLLYRFNLANPLFYYIAAARQAAVYGTVPSPGAWALLILMSASAFAIGVAVFRACKPRFGEFL